MGDDERRAEIEAVEQVLGRYLQGDRLWPQSGERLRAKAAAAVAALDASSQTAALYTAIDELQREVARLREQHERALLMAEEAAQALDFAHEFLDPCDKRGVEHWWTSWRINPQDAMREDRFCFECGVMEWQRLGGRDG